MTNWNPFFIYNIVSEYLTLLPQHKATLPERTSLQLSQKPSPFLESFESEILSSRNPEISHNS